MHVDPNMKVVEPSIDSAPIEEVRNDVLKSRVSGDNTAVSAPVSPLPVEIVTPAPAIADAQPQPAQLEDAPAAANPNKASEHAADSVSAPAADMPVTAATKSVAISFNDLEFAISDDDSAKIKTLAQDMLLNPNLMAKITSNCFDKNGNHAEARRVALQRAIKVRKILIDVGVNPNNVSVYAAEDLDLKSNNLSVTLRDEAPIAEIRK
jgi:outer membrane protein OmpA-like peptidoglycan-associated protein